MPQSTRKRTSSSKRRRSSSSTLSRDKKSRSAARKARSRRISSPMNRWQRFCRNTIVRFLFALIVFWGCAAFLLGAILFFRYQSLASQYDLRAVGRVPQATQVIDGTGSLLGYLRGENAASPVELSEISPYFINALIAREDSRFWRHGGIDYVGTVRAWTRNVKDKRFVQGASTLTMQLTRMTFGMRERTIKRKLLEMALAREVEKEYAKEEILAHYINRIFLGTGMNGIEQAAHGYFGKRAAELTLPEAAMIAGIIRAPNGFSPFRNYDAALREMRTTLARMVDERMITEEEALRAREVRPRVLPQDQWMKTLRANSQISPSNWILDMIDREVEERVPYLAESGGLRVETTFDLRLQKSAELATETWLRKFETISDYSHPRYSDHQQGDPEYLQASAVIMENHTGALRALIGGRNYQHNAYNRALYSRRQVGSVFKPLVYATAFEKGLFPGMLVSDRELAAREISWDDSGWSPQNSDAQYQGDTPVAQGLIRSRNTMTVRVGERAGIENVLTMMDQAGLARGREIQPSPMIYIGNIGANISELVSAYSVFPTGGIRHRPYFIERILDRDGSVLYQHEAASDRVVSPGAAWMTTHILKQVLEDGGTGARLRELGFLEEAGGKTGTTDDFHDAWFVGFTSRLTGGVWLGLDQPDTIHPGAYGGEVAVPIWKEIMSEARAIGYECRPFAPPEEVIKMNLCRHSGKLAGDQCSESIYQEWVPHDLIPRDFCKGHSH